MTQTTERVFRCDRCTEGDRTSLDVLPAGWAEIFFKIVGSEPRIGSVMLVSVFPRVLVAGHLCPKCVRNFNGWMTGP